MSHTLARRAPLFAGRQAASAVIRRAQGGPANGTGIAPAWTAAFDRQAYRCEFNTPPEAHLAHRPARGRRNLMTTPSSNQRGLLLAAAVGALALGASPAFAQ